jgi:arylsulfatase A-like enzyme
MQEDADSLTEADVADLLELYVGEIKFADRQLDRLFDLLEAKNLLSETAVIVTADHGEAFGEHDRFGHHPYLYDELLRVPLIVHAPGLESRTIDQQVSLLDLGPTLYDLLGIKTPDAVQGRSFAPLLRGEDMDEEVAIATGKGGGTLACRTSEWKCFWQVEKNKVELYDLQEDPKELNDVSDEHPEMVAEFKEHIEAYLDEAEATDIDLPEVETDDEVEQRLKDLGYR